MASRHKKRAQQLAAAKAKTTPSAKAHASTYAPTIAAKALSLTRSDVATWKAAQKQAGSVDTPKRNKLMALFKDILLDALLTSQLKNRMLQTISAPFILKDSAGVVDEEATALLKSSLWYRDIMRLLLEAIFFGHSLTELSVTPDGQLRVVLIPRENVEPRTGRFYPDADGDKFVEYRTAQEFGTWLLEFGEADDFGLLNKAVPHVLFKKFAQSCWSELCEIFGIPPRVMKTNTQDTAMLSRAESMMRDMGAAAWFIIDETEHFEFADGVATDGAVYDNLIRLCNNELSLLISGAIIGQDTKNGNESKEKVSNEVLVRLVDSDKRLAEGYWTSAILPALFRIGLLPEGLTFEFSAQQNTEELFKMTTAFLPHYEVSPKWIKERFGIEVTGAKQATQLGLSYSAQQDFFD